MFILIWQRRRHVEWIWAVGWIACFSRLLFRWSSIGVGASVGNVHIGNGNTIAITVPSHHGQQVVDPPSINLPVTENRSCSNPTRYYSTPVSASFTSTPSPAVRLQLWCMRRGCLVWYILSRVQDSAACFFTTQRISVNVKQEPN